MADPTFAIGAGLQAVGGILGFLDGRSQRAFQQEAMNSARGAGNNLMNFINGNTLGAGYAPNVIDQSLWPLMSYGQDMSNGMPQYMREFLLRQQGALGNYGQNILPGLMNPGGPGNDPYFQQYAGSAGGPEARLNYGLDTSMNNYNAQGWNPWSAETLGRTSQMGQGANPYMQDAQDYGNYMFKNGGLNPYNQGALDNAGFGMSRGGWSPQNQGSYDMFSGFAQNPYTQSITQGLGRAGGSMDFGQNLAGMGFSQLQNVNRFNSADPESFIGARGSATLDSLAASPFISGAYNTNQNLIRQGTANGGYTPQDLQMFQQSVPRAFGSVDQSMGQMNQGWGTALGKAQGSMDALPDWFNTFAMNAPGFNGSDMFSGLNMGAISGGGGGSASAGAMSRDLGPVDPKVMEAFDKGMAAFDKAEIMSIPQAASLARNQAATAAKQQGEAVARRAVNLGGRGATGFGGQNQAYADFADQALQAESKAVTDAVLQQQGLTLSRANMGAELTKAMQNAKSSREGVFAGMNIADAGNQTQASIASANSADAAANRSFQGQLAQQQNALAAAQLKSGLFTSLLNSATNLRGQNVDSSNAGLNTLAPLQNAMTQRQSMLFDNANQAGNRANQRYGATLGLSPQLNDSAQLDISRWKTMIDPLVASQGTGTARAGQYGDIMGSLLNAGGNFNNTGASLYGNMENSAANRFGSAVGGVGNSQNSANNLLSQYINMFNGGSQDSFNRATLGANQVNNANRQQLDWTNLGNSATNDMLNFGLNSGRLGLDQTNSQASLYDRLFQNSLGSSANSRANSQTAGGLYSDYLNQMNNSWNPIFQTGNAGANTLAGINSNYLNYSQSAMPLWGSYIQANTWTPGQPASNGLSALGNGLSSMGRGIQGGGGSTGGGTGGFSAGGFNMPGYTPAGPMYGIPGMPSQAPSGLGPYLPGIGGRP